MYDNKYNLTKEEYNLIVRSFFYIFANDLINTGKVYQLPRNLGTFSIRKKPIFGRGYFDYQLYKDTGVKRYIKNNHSSNYVSRFVWDTNYGRYDPKLPSGEIITFKPARQYARDLAAKIKNNNTIHRYYDY